ncbi:grpE protein homolog 1, mitochondrial-like isoform X2 [Littorina saxatilis]|uniref:grpE protein homolog 1, mitochondrial-like isoform X2 n=1 Tax=Littorina saxatilis TaxID=31220 RepID=UPI0038B4B6FC
MMAAAGSMCVRTVCGLSRATRSYLGSRIHRTDLLRMSSTAANDKPADTTESANRSQSAAEQPEQDPKQELAAAEKVWAEEKTKIELDLKEMKDKYIRSLAETENVRQRMKKQIDDAKLYGIQGFCKDLLEVADILQTATISVPQEELPKNPALKDLFDGLTMTEAQLQKVFGKHGLVPISPKEGEKFDPNFHEALFQVPTADKESETVAIVQKIGYKLHNRTVRPALVGVFKMS